MGAIFSKPKVQTVQPAVTEDDERVKAAAALEAERMKKRKGFMSTIMTGSGGLSGEATTEKKKLGE